MRSGGDFAAISSSGKLLLSSETNAVGAHLEFGNDGTLSVKLMGVTLWNSLLNFSCGSMIEVANQLQPGEKLQWWEYLCYSPLLFPETKVLRKVE